MWDKNKAGGCMTMTSGLVLMEGVFSSGAKPYVYSKRINKKRKPYELQYAPVFFLLFCMLLTLQSITNFSPLLNVF